MTPAHIDLVETLNDAAKPGSFYYRPVDYRRLAARAAQRIEELETALCDIKQLADRPDRIHTITTTALNPTITV